LRPLLGATTIQARVEGPAVVFLSTVSAISTAGRSPHRYPCQKIKNVILSEASEFVAPAFGRNNQFRRESKDLRLFFSQSLPPSFGKPRERSYALHMRERWYYVYIVASRTHALYIGVTGRIEPRIREHKNKIFEGFAADYNCNRLVYHECYDNPGSAIAREKQLKGWSRVKKLALIQKMNPTWIDLSEEWGKPIQPFTERSRQNA
jgi:putative endonuclease